MRYLLVTDSLLAPTIVSKAALPGEEVVVLCADAGLTRTLRRRGFRTLSGRLDADATWKRADLQQDDTLVVVALEDAAQAEKVVSRVSTRVADVPVVLLELGPDATGDSDSERTILPRNVERVLLTDIVRGPFQERFANAAVRRRVHEWRDHFSSAERVLILVHDEPDPDAIAAALALRLLLGRNRQTCTIGTFKGPTRPENIRLVELLGIDVTQIGVEDLPGFGRIAVVDTQPHIFGGRVTHVDLVMDQHPPRTGYTATFKDIRTSCGATTSLVLDYLIRCGIPISERLATAAAYAIKTDTWTFRRGTFPADVAIFAHVYPRADQSLLRRIENEGFTLATLHHIAQLEPNVDRVGRFVFVHVGEVPRDDLVPTTADFLLNLAEARWTACSGVLGDVLNISVRNLGYQRSAGELVQQVYGDIGDAGGHRAAARAKIPLAAATERFGNHSAPGFARAVFRPLWEAAGEFG